MTCTVRRRCNDAISSALRVAAGSGRPDSAQPTVTKLKEALEAVEQTRSQFKVRASPPDTGGGGADVAAVVIRAVVWVGARRFKIEYH